MNAASFSSVERFAVLSLAALAMVGAVACAVWACTTAKSTGGKPNISVASPHYASSADENGCLDTQFSRQQLIGS